MPPTERVSWLDGPHLMVASDVMVREYGRYFNMPTCSLRGGCLTGPSHSGVELHGFLSYLIKCNVTGTKYKIFDYKGKQVGDNIHSVDVARFIAAFIDNPRPGEVYNIGGGRKNSCSILEAFARIEAISDKPMIYDYVDQHRSGDHICYISDLRKMKMHYPNWGISKTLNDIFQEIYSSWAIRVNVAANQTCGERVLESVHAEESISRTESPESAAFRKAL